MLLVFWSSRAFFFLHFQLRPFAFNEFMPACWPWLTRMVYYAWKQIKSALKSYGHCWRIFFFFCFVVDSQHARNILMWSHCVIAWTKMPFFSLFSCTVNKWAPIFACFSLSRCSHNHWNSYGCCLSFHLFLSSCWSHTLDEWSSNDDMTVVLQSSLVVFSLSIFYFLLIFGMMMMMKLCWESFIT